MSAITPCAACGGHLNASCHAAPVPAVPRQETRCGGCGIADGDADVRIYQAKHGEVARCPECADGEPLCEKRYFTICPTPELCISNQQCNHEGPTRSGRVHDLPTNFHKPEGSA